MEEEEVNIQEAIDKYKLPKKCPPINWGQDFEDMPMNEKVAFLKKFANSFNYALDLMQKERNQLSLSSNHFEKQVIALKASNISQQKLFMNAVAEQNNIKVTYQIKINELEAQIKELT